jgi:hypothetical protein
MWVSRTSVEFICSMNYYERCISETSSPSRSVIPDPKRRYSISQMLEFTG